jgi:myo-inositol-1(or 4)-monophosphatase
MGLSPWDMAAGALLVREAGGLVGDFAGEDKFLESGRIVASNSKVFAAMLNILNARG